MAMPLLELPLPEEVYHKKALHQESFLVATDSLKPHPLHQRYSVPIAKEEYERLKDSIRRYGMRVPISIWDSRIVDGVNRWKIARELRMEHVPVLPLELTDEREAAIWIIRANLDRRQLTPGQRAMLAKHLYELERGRAEERRRSSLKKGQEKPTPPDKESFPDRGRGQARDLAAQQVGISGRTLEKAVKAVEKRPELEEKLKRGEISVEEAYRLAKGQEKPREKEPTEKGGRVPTVGPQVVVTLPRQHFDWLGELAKAWGLKEKELASRGLMEWLAAQTEEEGKEPQICVRLPWERFRVLERLCAPAGEPVAYLVRFILCSVALHPEKYPELLAPVRVDVEGE